MAAGAAATAGLPGTSELDDDSPPPQHPATSDGQEQQVSGPVVPPSVRCDVCRADDLTTSFEITIISHEDVSGANFQTVCPACWNVRGQPRNLAAVRFRNRHEMVQAFEQAENEQPYQRGAVNWYLVFALKRFGPIEITLEPEPGAISKAENDREAAKCAYRMHDFIDGWWVLKNHPTA